MVEKCARNPSNPIRHDEVGKYKHARRHPQLCFLVAGFRIDYLDRPTGRRVVMGRAQDTGVKRRGSRSPSASPASSHRSRSPEMGARSVSDEELPERSTIKKFKRDSRSSTPPVTPIAGRTVHGPFGSYLSSNDTASIRDTNDLMVLCEQLNVSASKTSQNAATVYPVQFLLKLHPYKARMHFLAGNPELVKSILGTYRRLHGRC